MNNYINVTCDFTDPDITGYQAILQFVNITYLDILMVKQFQTNSSNSFVVFEALMSGLYSVTVFPIMDNGGIVNMGISVAVHRENINVTYYATTTNAPSNNKSGLFFI